MLRRAAGRTTRTGCGERKPRSRRLVLLMDRRSLLKSNEYVSWLTPLPDVTRLLLAFHMLPTRTVRSPRTRSRRLTPAQPPKPTRLGASFHASDHLEG